MTNTVDERLLYIPGEAAFKVISSMLDLASVLTMDDAHQDVESVVQNVVNSPRLKARITSQT